MRNAFIFISILASFFVTSNAFANYVSDIDVTRLRIHSNGICKFAVSQSVSGTCSHYGEIFYIDTKTDEGKTMYKTLLLAKAMNRPIYVWYTDSSMPGTNQSSGCDTDTMAEVTGVGLP